MKHHTKEDCLKGLNAMVNHFKDKVVLMEREQEGYKALGMESMASWCDGLGSAYLGAVEALTRHIELYYSELLEKEDTNE